MRLLYASDVHGSEVCWRKFLNAAGVYDADVLIMGGDLTGKGIVPAVRQADGGWKATFKGRELQLEDEQQLAELERDISYSGMYTYRCTPEELQTFAGSAKAQEQVFDQLMAQSFGRWLEIGREKLDGSDTRCFVMPGNDDTWVIDQVFDPDDTKIINCDQRVVDLGDGYSMVSLSYSNPTPWDSPRELSEEELAALIEKIVAEVPDMSRAIFNLHVPPYGSGLDLAPALDSTLKPKVAGGQIESAPAGSTAVRDAIERHQPPLALHGHIHESKAARRLGQTLCINPGSSYGLGQLDGVIVDLRKEKVRRYQFVSG
jgi:Icc-related predicted phosphoesterase